uniref:TSA: Wollemia nobilis Ref_Wollemi_Transcript_15803_1072 transcribed RNA sequence n=1 Tax=Wollemia nobilis TaxID=56998 RepID=A0A0C9S609_9CONI
MKCVCERAAGQRAEQMDSSDVKEVGCGPPSTQIIKPTKTDDLEEESGDCFEDPLTEYSEEDEDSDSSDDEDDLLFNDTPNCDLEPGNEYPLEGNEHPYPLEGTAEPIDIVYENIKKTKLKPCERRVRGLERGPQEVLWERRKGQVLMEGFVEEPISNDEVKGSDALSEGAETPNQNSKSFSRAKSLTDEDLDELKGCLDLGFGFNYEEIPELCNTLPALELCYSISQKFQDEQQKSPLSTMDGGMSDTCSNNGCCTQSPIANWKISSPGDRPEQVKARLKFWAQAVACTVRLCS